MKIILRILIGLIALILITFIGFFAYTKINLYRADLTDLASDVITYGEKEGHALVFTPDDLKAHLIFYPGGLVEKEAYIYLAYLLSLEGFQVYLVDMPFHLAIFGINRAKEIMKNNESDLPWFIGGHSLGGASASIFVKQNPQSVEGIFFLGSYPSASSDLSLYNLKVISILGDHDLIIDIDQYNQTKKLLPTHTHFITIEGGNHSYFGYYGQQKKDGTATVTRKAQHDFTVSYISEIFLNLNAS